MVGGSGSLSGGKYLELKTDKFNIIAPVVRPRLIHVITQNSATNAQVPGTTVLEITPVVDSAGTAIVTIHNYTYQRTTSQNSFSGYFILKMESFT